MSLPNLGRLFVVGDLAGGIGALAVTVLQGEMIVPAGEGDAVDGVVFIDLCEGALQEAVDQGLHRSGAQCAFGCLSGDEGAGAV